MNHCKNCKHWDWVKLAIQQVEAFNAALADAPWFDTLEESFAYADRQ